MSAVKPNLLDLFIICNVPSSSDFQLFCRFLNRDDCGTYGYFKPGIANQYPLPVDFEAEAAFYDQCRYHESLVGNSALIDGLNFGTFHSYDAALEDAKSYPPEVLLKKFFEIYQRSIEFRQRED